MLASDYYDGPLALSFLNIFRPGKNCLNVPFLKICDWAIVLLGIDLEGRLVQDGAHRDYTIV